MFLENESCMNYTESNVMVKNIIFVKYAGLIFMTGTKFGCILASALCFLTVDV